MLPAAQRLAGFLAPALAAFFALALPAEAYVPAVDRGAASEVALNVIGVLFTVAFSAFLLRVLRKRADRASSVRLVAENRARRAPAVPDTPPSAASCFVGAAMAAVIAAVLLYLSGLLDDWFQQQPQSGARGGVCRGPRHTCADATAQTNTPCATWPARCGPSSRG